MINRFLSTLLSPEEGRKPGFIPLEKLVFSYIILTTLFIAMQYSRLAHPFEMIAGRVSVVTLIIVLWQLYLRFPCRLTFFLRIAAHLGLLAYWYPDTYEFNRVSPNLDHLFAEAEQWIFHSQPALTMHEALPSPFWSEAFNLGYYAYYPMIALVALYYFFAEYARFERATFIIISAFYLYYLVYILLPVAGPQFYFLAIGLEQAKAGNFPAIGDYFNYCRDIMTAPGYSDGLFYKLVTAAQDGGERPTAAFPSSHIGISTILLMLAHKVKPKMCYLLLPFYLLLCGATVYIQAHYVIDGVAGVLTAIPCYYACKHFADRYIRLYK